MAKKILIEEKTINSLIKAIEIHLNLIREAELYIKNDFYRDKLIKSMEYLDNATNNIKSYSKDIATLKRKAYFRYSKAKKELTDLKGNNADNDIIANKEIEVNKALELYIALKDIKI